MSEFNLSEKEMKLEINNRNVNVNNNLGEFYLKEDVKEFISRLRIKLNNNSGKLSNKDIDKLAGSELVGEENEK